jgi:hypothetical protein
MKTPTTQPSDLTRRAWLAALAIGGIGIRAFADEAKQEEERARAEVEERAKRVGLGKFRAIQSTHYQVLGNAPEAFCQRALKVCEGLARDFLEHFRYKGFKVDRPSHRLTLVTLADADSFAKFQSAEPGPGMGGVYDLDTNRLVIFDNRAQGDLDPNVAARANLLSLAHEATHQLTYNTGLLDRAGDVPPCLSEGLAMYAEIRKPSGPSRLGQVNQGRLDGFAFAHEKHVRWIPLDRLLTDDALFGAEADPNALQMAYAESWLLVYELMRPKKPAAFSKYLATIRSRRDAQHRLEDAQASLGDLGHLDEELRRSAHGLTGIAF